jgi:DNA replication protein DnaC
MIGKSHLVQGIGREVVKAGHPFLYRSIFDLVRELLSQDTQERGDARDGGAEDSVQRSVEAHGFRAAEVLSRLA